MKHLKESLLNKDFDIDISPCAVEVFKLLDTSECHHLNNPPLQFALLYKFPIQDKLHSIFTKHAKRISASTARRKDNVVICHGYDDEMEMYIKIKGNVFESRQLCRKDDYKYAIQYSQYWQNIKYSTNRNGEFFEIPEDVADIIYKEFEYFDYIKYNRG